MISNEDVTSEEMKPYSWIPCLRRFMKTQKKKKRNIQSFRGSFPIMGKKIKGTTETWKNTPMSSMNVRLHYLSLLGKRRHRSKAPVPQLWQIFSVPFERKLSARSSDRGMEKKNCFWSFTTTGRHVLSSTTHIHTLHLRHSWLIDY